VTAPILALGSVTKARGFLIVAPQTASVVSSGWNWSRQSTI